FHSLKGRQAPGIRRLEEELGLPIVIGRTQKAVHRGTDMAGLLGHFAALEIAVGDAQPFGVPALEIAGNDARSRLKDLTDRAAAFLAFAEAAPKLISEPGMLGPVMPAIGLVMGRPIGSDPFDRIVGGIGHGNSTLDITELAPPRDIRSN